MRVVRAADRSVADGSREWFTGQVRVTEIDRAGVMLVQFAPRARTAWHVHPHGQALHILEGAARVGHADGTVEQLLPGDGAWIAPGERHWHGAGPGAAMTHIAVSRADRAGDMAHWEQHVDDREYGA